MANLFLYAIGGTGSRVLRSLTMLLSSGVECPDTIVPVIIDPDTSNGDLTRTVTLMQRYQKIRQNLNFGERQSNHFFQTSIEERISDFKLRMDEVQNVKFKDYIHITEMNDPNKALAKALFSTCNLESDMRMGFKGHPNMGSVVMNQLENNQDFRDVAQRFNPGDKIFIVSSIFGGTGASGFPVLLKLFRQSQTLPNHALLNNANIGALMVLPYFQVHEDPFSEIDSATFISKSKSALSYYERTMANGGASPNKVYYIADNTKSTYQNNEGNDAQKNNAHIVELAAALAVLDFSRAANANNLNAVDYKEFGIDRDSNSIDFSHLDLRTVRNIRKPMTQLLLFSKYMKEKAPETDQPWAKDNDFDVNYYTSDFVTELNSFLAAYQLWLSELQDQTHAFSPFKLHQDPNRVFDILNDAEPRKVLTTIDRNYALFNNRLNKVSLAQESKEQNFMNLFYQATARLSDEKFNIN